MTYLRTLILFAAALTFSISVLAGDGVSFTIHHLYQAPRPLGMGDAFVAVANDYSALFYNPAGLARRDDGQVNLSVNVAGSVGIADFSNQINEIQNSSMSESDQQTAMFNLIESKYGETYGVRLAPLEGIWVRPNWGIGFVPADISLEMTMHQQVGPAINTTVYADSYLALGYGEDFKGVPHGQLSWGVTGKFVNRGWASMAISATELAADSQVITKEDLKEGYTIDADVGLLWTPELPSEGIFSWLTLTRPTFGAVIRNVAETGFGQSLHLLNDQKTEAPEKLYRVLDLGSRWEYPSLWIFKGRGVLDIRDIGHPNWNWSKGTHLGFEFDWYVSSWWKGHYRAGLSEGFWTGGVSAELGIFNLDFVSYADDVGTFSTPVENRIYALKLNLDF